MGRNRITAALRGWFATEDFVSVEGAALQISPGNETHLHAFATTETDLSGNAGQLYLHTSPEFAAKKLIAAGETRIVDFARVFRNRERSALHHPEFTMLEWYRADAGLDAQLRERFNTGFAAGQSAAVCGPASLRAEAAAAARGQALANRLSSIMRQVDPPVVGGAGDAQVP
jgi:lysyl-tRNA synthetase class 2